MTDIIIKFITDGLERNYRNVSRARVNGDNYMFEYEHDLERANAIMPLKNILVIEEIPS